MLSPDQHKSRILGCENQLTVLYAERELMRARLAVLREKIRDVESKISRSRARLDVVEHQLPDPYTSPLWADSAQRQTPPTPLSDIPK